MSRKLKVMAIVVGLVMFLLVAVILLAPSAQRSFFYPKPKALPAEVEEPIEGLLERFQRILETNAPSVANALQPGLSETQITALEAQGGFKLSEDLRATYRWHNGMSTNGYLDLIPGHRFLPLEEIVSERSAVRQQIQSATAMQQAAFAALVGHRKDWVNILADGAGDGYFYDPMRPASQGAFFYHFGEIRHYVWFPSFRNFIAAATEAWESRAFHLEQDGRGPVENGDQSQTIWQRFGQSSDQ